LVITENALQNKNAPKREKVTPAGHAILPGWKKISPLGFQLSLVISSGSWKKVENSRGTATRPCINNEAIKERP
jgi:hypothetical protein